MINRLWIPVAGFVIVMFAACSSGGSKDSATQSEDSTMRADSIKSANMVKIQPAGPKPDWAPSIKPEMLAVMEKLASYGDKPIETLSPTQARKNHTPTDAVMDVMKDHKIPKPIFNIDTMGKDIPVDGGKIHLRIYKPKAGNGPFPMIMYYHGGGFVIADLDVYDAAPSIMADQAGAIVISVAYRLAPEHKFPTAHNDAFFAYKWVLANAASIKGDPKKVAVTGESAGANLALNVAIMARDNNLTLPTAILAVYPVAGADMNTSSYIKNAAAKPLNKPMMGWFVKQYLNNPAEAKDPRINLVAANLKGLPPTTVITAEIDPLQSEGMMLTDRLRASGVTVDSKNYDGVTHEFFGMGTVLPQARDAETYAVSQLKKAFAF